ncbi:hypothetical protein BP5796_09179 [Coleophoma crateriformis]|uniref:Alpha/beta hydrolase fold-3 domain-containing protein n=1 Tax=Coleophoma crateriformis TaxID=565419 RepID=A0A3D8R396_9HELO|nr:hypothetical protein BP5796_09179 [Coleophoma crateriformis]
MAVPEKSPGQPSLSFAERLDLIPAIASTLGAALYAAITGPFRGSWGAHTYRHHITHALLRKFTSRLSTAQLQYLTAPFHAIYEKWCQKAGTDPEYVVLPSGCRAFWVGHKTATNIVVYFHGGGFSLDGTPGHLHYWSSVQTDLTSAGQSTAVLFVEYTLVPYATYPIQIREGIEAIQYVVTDLGRAPSTVTLSGDSAGANLCLAILSHIMHPNPDLPAMHLTQPVKALILVAPWVTFQIQQPSSERNAHKDIFKPATSAQWGANYLAGKATSAYAEALLAPAEWWRDALVEGVLVVAGAEEILVDAISLWAEKFQSVNPGVLTYVIAKNEGHVAPFIEWELGDTAETEQGEAIRSWMKWRF